MATGSEPVRVLIVDDHAVVRSGLRLLLNAEPDVDVVGEAADGLDALTLDRELEPDVVLMDLLMPGLNGIEATRSLLRERPEAKVLVLSMQDDPRYVREAFAAGATGYVLKEAADTEVVAAVRQVARGGRGALPRRARPAVGARAGRAASAGSRAHEPADRAALEHLDPHRRDAQG